MCRRFMTCQSGMTLLEVMVAISLTVIAGLIAFSAIQSASENSQHIQQRTQALMQLDNAVYWLASDIRRTVPLPLPVKNKELASVYAMGDEKLLLSVRGFDSLPYSVNSIAQIEYHFQEGRLIRKRIAAASNVAASKEKILHEEVLLENIQKFELRFLDAGTAKFKEWPEIDRWTQRWPGRAARTDAMPWAIWFSIEGEQIGRIERLIEMSGSYRE